MDQQVTPEPILQLGLAFWGSKTLLSAVELGLFTHLANGPCDAKTVAMELELHAKSGISMGAAVAIAEKFPWDKYQTVIDIGAAEGCVPVQVALRHPHLSGGGFDLPAVAPSFEKHAAAFGLADRLRFYPGDFFA